MYFYSDTQRPNFSFFLREKNTFENNFEVLFALIIEFRERNNKKAGLSSFLQHVITNILKYQITDN